MQVVKVIAATLILALSWVIYTMVYARISRGAARKGGWPSTVSRAPLLDFDDTGHVRRDLVGIATH
jgi:hypothetical protein